MDPWTFDRYRSPYLAIEAVSLDPEARTIEVAARGSSYIIEGDNSLQGLTVLAERLTRLRDPRSEVWHKLCTDKADELCKLLNQMDTLGLIEDSCSECEEDKYFTYLSDCVESVHENIARELSSSSVSLLRPLSDYARIACRSLFDRRVPDLADIGSVWSTTERSGACFYVEAALRQLKYHVRYAPLSFIFAYLLLERLTDHCDISRSQFGETEVRRVAMEFMSTTNIKDTAAHLNSLGYLILKSLSSDRVSGRRGPVSPSGCSGITLAIQAERLCSDVLEQLGESSFLRSISTAPVSQSLVKGCFIEGYHVTSRFVEIIAATLPWRWKPSIRNLLFRYYAEEIGHEKFERTTCEALGIGEDVLSVSVPLPLHTAFVDVFTHAAHCDPISYFAAIFITEGMFGAPSPLNSHIEKGFGENPQFLRVFRRHESLNDELSHSSLSRVLLSEVEVITPAQASRALQTVSVLTELNYRAWDALHEHYRNVNAIPYHGMLPGTPPV